MNLKDICAALDDARAKARAKCGVVNVGFDLISFHDHDWHFSMRVTNRHHNAVFDVMSRPLSELGLHLKNMERWADTIAERDAQQMEQLADVLGIPLQQAAEPTP